MKKGRISKKAPIHANWNQFMKHEISSIHVNSEFKPPSSLKSQLNLAFNDSVLSDGAHCHHSIVTMWKKVPLPPLHIIFATETHRNNLRNHHHTTFILPSSTHLNELNQPIICRITHWSMIIGILSAKILLWRTVENTFECCHIHTTSRDKRIADADMNSLRSTCCSRKDPLERVFNFGRRILGLGNRSGNCPRADCKDDG